MAAIPYSIVLLRVALHPKDIPVPSSVTCPRIKAEDMGMTVESVAVNLSVILIATSYE